MECTFREPVDGRPEGTVFCRLLGELTRERLRIGEELCRQCVKAGKPAKTNPVLRALMCGLLAIRIEDGDNPPGGVASTMEGAVERLAAEIPRVELAYIFREINESGLIPPERLAILGAGRIDNNDLELAKGISRPAWYPRR